MAKENKDNELETFKKWQQTQDPRYFQSLYVSMKPLLHRAAEKASYGSNLPTSAHQIWAAQNFHDALRTYKPNTGASLQTHVFNAVHQKAKRLNYMYQNLGHVPEPRAAQIGLFQTEKANMHDALGREPSAAELADRLGWSVRQVSNIQKEIHKDLALGEGTEEQPVFETPEDEETLHFLYYSLTGEEQLVYDYIMGQHGKPRMVKANNKIDFDRIARSTGFSTSKTRAVHARIKAKLERELKR